MALGKAQSLRPEAVVWQLVKFFAGQVSSSKSFVLDLRLQNAMFQGKFLAVIEYTIGRVSCCFDSFSYPVR